MPSRRLVCPTMHAEMLHDDSVWAALTEVLAAWADQGVRWTLFVAPLRARIVDRDLGDRLQWLDQQGHEVGMHTHFYHLSCAPGAPVSYEKRKDLSPSNVVRCLTEDWVYLQTRGHVPRGFVSGAWVIHDSVRPWLQRHGFAYDCSLRSYRLAYDHDDAAAGDEQRDVQRAGTLTYVPTTGSIRSQLTDRLRRRRGGLRVAGRYYELFYLHDYDLLDRRVRLALSAVRRLARGDEFVTGSQLVDSVGPSVS